MNENVKEAEQLELNLQHACAKCKHPLSNPLSVYRGYGPKCWKKLRCPKKESAETPPPQ